MNNRKVMFVVLSLFIGLSACKEDEPGMDEIMTNMLTVNAWSDAVVTHGVDGDLSFQYENFAIQFTKQPANGYQGNFLVSNGGSAFPDVAGKWKFSDNLQQIVFDTGKEMVFELSENRLMLDFTVTASGGRVSGLDGHFIFELTPLQ